MTMSSFDLEKGSPLGFVGESGCGKTTIGMTLMGLLPDNGKILGGEIRFGEKDLARLSEDQWRGVRGREMAMIFQAAMNALNPVYRVDDQIKEAIITHHPNVSEKDLNLRLEELFDLVEMPLERSQDYPHEYSGGMKTAGGDCHGPCLLTPGDHCRRADNGSGCYCSGSDP